MYSERVFSLKSHCPYPFFHIHLLSLRPLVSYSFSSYGSPFSIRLPSSFLHTSFHMEFGLRSFTLEQFHRQWRGNSRVFNLSGTSVLYVSNHLPTFHPVIHFCHFISRTNDRNYENDWSYYKRSVKNYRDLLQFLGNTRWKSIMQLANMMI